jgi:hypothetical protein
MITLMCLGAAVSRARTRTTETPLGGVCVAWLAADEIGGARGAGGLAV